MDKSQTLDLHLTRLVLGKKRKKHFGSACLAHARIHIRGSAQTKWGGGGGFSAGDVLAALYYLIVPRRYGFQVKFQLSPHLRNGPQPESHTDEALPSALSSPARVPNHSEISYTWSKLPLWEPDCF